MNKTYNKTKWPILACLMILSHLMFGQATMITGQVMDDEGNPLPGATVMISGTSRGTVTDISGNFNIEAGENDMLVVTFVGFQDKIIAINGQNNLSIRLNTDIAELQELVVVGYGTAEKKDVTGAMSTLSPKDFNKGIVSNPIELIQGRAAGVQITPSSGEPGGAINVSIRGMNSIRSGNDPLFVIDGVPIGGGNVSPGGSDVGDVGGSQARNPLNFLNPEDIASIDILKDASATAIYGSRGANGVVLITTKKGSAGQSTFSYSTYAGVSQIRKKIDVLSATDYRNARILLAAETGNTGYLDFDFGADTDWQDEIFRTAISQNHNISFSGGTYKGNFRASLGYMDQQGIVIGTAMKRITGRINLNQKLIDDRLKVGLNFTASNIHDRGAPIGDGGGSGFLGDALANALKANPTMPVTQDGTYFQFSAADRNPVAMIRLIDDQTTTNRLLANATAELMIIKGLNYHLNIGADKTLSTRNTNFSQDLIFITPQGRAEIQDTESTNITFENYFSYNKTFRNSSFSAMTGFSYQRFETNWHSLVGQGYESTEILPTGNIGGHSGEIEPQIYSGGPISELQSVYGRLNFSYQEKYLATASLRADGSSRFGPDNRYGFFPSGALGWRIAEESFLQDVDAISELKLRLGWGQTGNQEFADYIPYRIVTKNPNTGGLQVVQVQNPEIQWETTTQSNIGIDFGIMDNKIIGSVDYFHKSTTDLLFDVPLPAPSITERGWQNIPAKLINKGIELSLNVHWVSNSEWSWTSNINFTKITNTIEDFSTSINTGLLNGQGLTNISVQVIEEGQALQTFYLRKFIGFDNEGISQYANDGELIYAGSPHPDYTVSLNNTLSFKDFDFSFFIDSKQGHYVYNNTANALFNKSSLGQAKNITYDELYSSRNIEDAVLPSTRYLEDASFIRLATTTLAWNIPVDAEIWSAKPKVFITGQNLLVLTNYSGFDPEVNTNKAVNGVPSFGIDYTSYPRPRTILLGLNLSF